MIKAVAMATTVDVEERVILRQQNRQNAPAATISEYWKRNMWLPFIDYMAADLSERLLNTLSSPHCPIFTAVHIAQLTAVKVHALYVSSRFAVSITGRI